MEFDRRPPFRVFLATRKEDAEENVRAYEAVVRESGTKEQLPLDVVRARDHYEERFKVAGGWPGWIKEVVNDFDLVLVCLPDPEPPYYIGKATKDIVERRLTLGKRVALFCLGFESVLPVAHVAHARGPDYQIFVQTKP